MSTQSLVIENLKLLSRSFPLEKIQVLSGSIVVVVKPNIVFDMLLFFRNHVLCQFEMLTCISGIDFPSNKYRFSIVYELLSLKYNCRIRVKTFTNELISIQSSEKLFLASGWYECEIWDMFGVFFYNHSNLKRILTDYGFEGYPLRKDFPLSGFVEMRYNETEKRVCSESIELCQEYRTFNYSSPWENNTRIV